MRSKFAAGIYYKPKSQTDKSTVNVASNKLN
jgi:hypothetical protein